MESWIMGWSIGWLLGAAIFFLVDYFISREFYQVAQMKGYSEKKYFWIPFWLTLWGYLLVIALPDRGNGNSGSSFDKKFDELPPL